jgi:hypothetical protein
MADNERPPVLGPNKQDRLASALRAIANAVPVVGNAIAEIITEIIPNQRIERVEQYLQFLASEIEALNLVDSTERMKRPENIELVEEGVYQATRAITEERRRYLARAVAHGIASDAEDRINESQILKLIESLDDRDLLILNAYQTRVTLSQTSPFAKLIPDRPTINSSQEVRERYGFFRAAVDRLERVSLIRKRVPLNKNSLPDFDRFTGEPKGQYEITPLGRLLLKRVGLERKD